MTTKKYVCANSGCPSPDLTTLVTLAKGKRSVGILESYNPEPKPSFSDVELHCPYCKTRQMFSVGGEAEEVRGRPILDTEAAAIDKLRTLFEPQKSAERLESFGTWLFTGTAFFTTLTGFYVHTVHDKVKEDSQFFFTVALALLGLSMAFAAWMKAPGLKSFNPDSPSSMLKALEERAKKRGVLLLCASILFAAALAVAGAAPALGAWVSSKPEARVATRYTRDASGKLSAVLTATAMKPGDVFGARIRKKDDPRTVLVEGAQTVKADGTGELTLEVAKLEAAGGPWELATYTRAQGAEKDAEVHVLTGLAAPVQAPKPSLDTAFSYTAKGKLLLEAQGWGLLPNEPVELHVRQGAQVLGWTRGLASQAGAVALKLELPAVDASQGAVVLTMSGMQNGKLEPLFERPVPGAAKVVQGN